MESTLITQDGTILIDRRKYPHLYRALRHQAEALKRWRTDWARVAELRSKGRYAKADRIARRLLGIKGPPMSEETKAALKAWKQAHKEEIRQRAKEKRNLMKRTMELLARKRR